MILKDKVILKTTSVTAIAGQKQEQDVAFFLRRAFKDHEQVFVINDFKFQHNDENAQIDHLIIYPYGFILVESKSITGEVKINSLGEWTRSLNNKWSGMASPIKQVELQQKLLKDFLHANRQIILGKLFGIKQQSFGMRCWDNVCAISSKTLINRDSIQKDLSKHLVKSEFLVDKLNEIMKMKTYAITKLNPFDTRPDFSNEELKSITSFLMEEVNNKVDSKVIIKEPYSEFKVSANTISKIEGSRQLILKCKSCEEMFDYVPLHGRYGYFIRCNKCEVNTAMKMPCLKCSSKNTKVSKNNETYTLICDDCMATIRLI